MGPNDKTTSIPLEWFRNTLSNWEELTSSSGKFEGTAKSVTGGKEIYDEAGNYKGFVDNYGNRTDVDGNPVPKD